jgi:uncharacterized protein YcaQ
MTKAPSIGQEQAAAFRLRRHHLAERSERDLVRVCGNVCGVQSQVDSAGRLALATRMVGLKPSDVERALWRDRTLMKGSFMRQTVHLVPAADYAMYIAALRKSRRAAALRVMARCGATEQDAARLDELILQALDGHALTNQQIRAAVTPGLSKNMRGWMDKVWSILRTVLADGLVCYGGEGGPEVTYVRVDQWLPGTKRLGEREAQMKMFRGYLRAYGPATLQDFSRWAGIPMADVRPVGDALRPELAEVEVEGAPAFILHADLQQLRRARPRSVVRLLPAFDPYLLAHADKQHLVPARFYKRVYRNQGWVSAVLLLDGRIAGVWTSTRKGKRLQIHVEPFEKLAPSVRMQLEEEAVHIAAFTGAEVELQLNT